MKKRGRKKLIYAMYKDDELLSMGTMKEICEKMGITEQTFRYYRTNAYKERIKNRPRRSSVREVIRVED